VPTDPTTLVQTYRGRFIVLDGPDGAGKSTQQKLLADFLETAGAEVVSCRDPGGTEIGNRIRSVLLDYDLSKMAVNCETLLFMASRAQLVSEVIRPALQAGNTVVCDRFVTSTCAYQGAAGDDPKRVIEIAGFAIGNCWPDVTVVIDVDTDEGFERIEDRPARGGGQSAPAEQCAKVRNGRHDAMEARSADFHRRVREMFLTVHQYYPTPVVVVDGRGDVDAVHQRILEALSSVTP